MRGCTSDPWRKSLIQAAARSPSWGSSSGTTETATPAGAPRRGRARPELVGGLPGTPDVRGDVPFAALGPRPREGGRPSRSGRKAAGRPRGGQRGGGGRREGADERGPAGEAAGRAGGPARPAPPPVWGRASAAAGAGPRREPGAGSRRRGPGRGRRASAGPAAAVRTGRAGGRAAPGARPSPRRALPATPSWVGPAPPGGRRAARRGAPGPASPLTCGRAAAGSGCGLGDGRRGSLNDALPAPLHSATAAPQRRHRKRPRRSQSAPGC